MGDKPPEQTARDFASSAPARAGPQAIARRGLAVAAQRSGAALDLSTAQFGSAARRTRAGREPDGVVTTAGTAAKREAARSWRDVRWTPWWITMGLAPFALRVDAVWTAGDFGGKFSEPTRPAAVDIVEGGRSHGRRVDVAFCDHAVVAFGIVLLDADDLRPNQVCHQPGGVIGAANAAAGGGGGEPPRTRAGVGRGGQLREYR